MILRIGNRGDTLVEVTIAMAILSAVIISSFTLANRAFSVGQSARERSELINTLQQQAEALTSFRNATTWPHFVSGNAPTYSGITVNGAGCFHMATSLIGGQLLWVPVSGTTVGPQVPTSIICIKQRPVSSDLYTFDITYTATAYGGSSTYNQDLVVQLANLDILRGGL